MPRADRFTPTGTTQTPKPSPADYAQVPRAISRAGAGLSQVAGQAFSAIEAIERAERLVRVKELQFMYRDAFEKKRIENLQQTDYSNFEQRAAENVEEIRAVIDEAAGDDEKLRQAIDIDFKTNAARHQNLLKLRRIQELEKSTLAIVGRMEQENMVAYANSATLEEAAAIKTNYFAELDALASGGTINPNQIQTAKTRFDDNAEDARVEAAIQADPDTAIEMINAGEFDLDPKEKQTALNRANAIKEQREKAAKIEENILKAASKEAEVEAREVTNQQFVDKFVANTLIPTEIQNSNLLSGQKLNWLDRLDRQAKAIVAGEKDPFEIHDPKVYREWSDKVTNDPESIESTDEIWAAVDNTKDAEALSKRWTAWKKGEKASKPKLDPVMTALHKESARRIGRALTADVFDEESAGRLHLKWDTYIEKIRTGEIKATPVEALEYFETVILEPEKKNKILEVIEKIGKTFLLRGALGFPFEPIREKIDKALEEATGIRKEAIQALKDGGYDATDENIAEAIRQIRARE